jgi:signal transduction histidine kinase
VRGREITMLRLTIAATMLLAFAPAAVRGDERASTKDAQGMVRQAVALVKKEGKAKAFAVFNDPKGAFTYRDLYIAAYDLEGNCLAHGQKKERVGKNYLADKDPTGKEFVKERIALAKKDGKGWQEYKFMNPVTKKVEDKVAYFEVVEGVILVCGAYKE